MIRSLEGHELIERTLRTALLIDPFWDRWKVHGLLEEDLILIRKKLTSIQSWIEEWSLLASQKKKNAEWKESNVLHQVHSDFCLQEAENLYRLSGLYYNLIQWIFPVRQHEKQEWYKKSLKMFKEADSLSIFTTIYDSLLVNEQQCAGRIRIPTLTKGVIIIINPIDSCKEELYMYEEDFNQGGYITVSFDGPGQGETYTLQGLRGTKKRWESFMEEVIQYVALRFPYLSIYLFGTSLGGSWALYGSAHPNIKKTVVVSPAVSFEKLFLPAYFLERMDYSCTLVPEERAIPNFDHIFYRSPVLLIHGLKDQLVKTSDMYELYNSIQVEKYILEYEEEGHCCNYKLKEIRQRAMKWFEE